MPLFGLVTSFSITAAKGPVIPPDYTPEAVNWTNVASITSSGTTNVQQITDISVPITLEISWSGNLGYFYMAVNTSNSYGGTIFLLDTSPKEIQVANDNYVSFRLDSIGLQDNLARSVTVTNKSDSNTVLDTFTVDVDGSSTKSQSYAFNLFWDRETLIDRYDSTASSTTAKGWFIR